MEWAVLGFASPTALCQASHADGPLESVFEALDGREFEIDGAACHVEVYGIWDDGGHRWVQLALDGNRHQMLTLRLREPEDPECALVSAAAAPASDARVAQRP